MKGNRVALIAVCAAASLVLAACEGGEEKGEGQKQEERGGETSVTVVRADTMACMMSGTLINNRGQGDIHVHLTVSNKCYPPSGGETLTPPYQPARVRVVDGNNAVVGGQDYQIGAGQTDDSRLRVPSGARIALDCARGFMITRHGCSWSYTYSP
jgi:hypothetical protein